MLHEDRYFIKTDYIRYNKLLSVAVLLSISLHQIHYPVEYFCQLSKCLLFVVLASSDVSHVYLCWKLEIVVGTFLNFVLDFGGYIFLRKLYLLLNVFFFQLVFLTHSFLIVELHRRIGSYLERCFK